MANSPEELKKIASTLRKAAHDLAALKEKRVQEKREKCASVLVATVGLNTMKEKLENGRR